MRIFTRLGGLWTTVMLFAATYPTRVFADTTEVILWCGPDKQPCQYLKAPPEWPPGLVVLMLVLVGIIAATAVLIFFALLRMTKQANEANREIIRMMVANQGMSGAGRANVSARAP